MNNLIEVATNFAKLIGKIETEWHMICDEIKNCENEISDLLHEIELTEFNAREGYKLAKFIQEVRRRRRDLKNHREVIGYLREFACNNKGLDISLHKVCTNMKKTKDTQQCRNYTPRIRTDLKLVLLKRAASEVISDEHTIYGN